MSSSFKKNLSHLLACSQLVTLFLIQLGRSSERLQSNNNLYKTIKTIREKIGDDHKQQLNQLLEKFEHTARQRTAFSHSEAGFTIQMLNNKIEKKKELIWGNKQPRYPNYLFGLSKNEIDAYTDFMKPSVLVGA